MSDTQAKVKEVMVGRVPSGRLGNPSSLIFHTIPDADSTMTACGVPRPAKEPTPSAHGLPDVYAARPLASLKSYQRDHLCKTLACRQARRRQVVA